MRPESDHHGIARTAGNVGRSKYLHWSNRKYYDHFFEDMRGLEEKNAEEALLLVETSE